MLGKLIVIAGPTAVGKTAVAIQLAQHYNTAILSVDSRQCYRELTIGVAKPSLHALQAVPHYFINSHSIHQPINAVSYQQYALGIIKTLFAKHNTIIVVGGTGLYLNALLYDANAVPEIPNEVTLSVQQLYLHNGLAWLQAQIQKLDSAYTNANDLNNTHRMLRALAVVTHTGNTITHYKQIQQIEPRSFIHYLYGLQLPREQLYTIINNRVLQMIDDGLLNEVKTLVPYQHLQALQTVGYTELFGYINGMLSLPLAIEKTQQHTRNYAKRQVTWFSKMEGLKWLTPNNAVEVITKEIPIH